MIERWPLPHQKAHCRWAQSDRPNYFSYWKGQFKHDFACSRLSCLSWAKHSPPQQLKLRTFIKPCTNIMVPVKQSNKNKKLKVKGCLRHCWCWQNFESSITCFLHWLPSIHPSHKHLWTRAFISCLCFLVSPCLPLHSAPNVNEFLRQKLPETSMHLNSTLMSLCADADAQAWVH